MRIVKNVGQVPELKGKYILKVCDKDFGDMYAKIGIKPIIARLICNILYG